MSDTSRTTRMLVTLVVLACLLLGACTSPGAEKDSGAAPTTSATPSPGVGSRDPEASSTPTPSPTPQPPRPPRPPLDACYRLGLEQATAATSGQEPVRCSEPHQGQTIHVGRLDVPASAPPAAVSSARVQRQLARECPARLAQHLGGTAQARNLTRFEVVWFRPTLAQAARGARWYRCDLIALAAESTLARLPTPRRTKGILDRAAGAPWYGLCGTSRPGSRGFARVICGREHRWRAVATLALEGGRRYPGVRRVRAAGDAPCSNRVRAQAPDPLRFEYGWEWPTRAQWEAGQRFGYCWAPA